MCGPFLQIHRGQLARSQRAGKGHHTGQASGTWEVVSGSVERSPADSNRVEQGTQRSPHSSGLGPVLEGPVFGRNPRVFWVC